MHISVDRTRCQGHAVCLMMEPDLFGFDDEEGRAFVLGDERSDDEAEQGRRAAANCPEGAIRVGR